MSRPRARSRNSARAVRNTIGISEVPASSSSSSATCQPSSPGIITSSRIASGRPVFASSSPAGPFAASSTAIPSASRFTRQRSLIGASSSITSTVVMPSADVYPPRRMLVTGQRERKTEARALTLGGVDPDSPAHRRHESLRDEEPEPGPAGAALCGRFGPVELPEDPLLLEARDPDALVDDADLDRVVAAPRLDGDGAAAWRVFNCVLEQVLEHLAYLLAVRLRGERLRRRVEH